MRLRGLVRKEFLQIVRDPSSIAIAFLMPIFLLVLFGYGVSLDADHVPVAVVADAPSQDSADFTASLQGSHYFVPSLMGSMPRGRAGAARGQGEGHPAVCAADFSRRMRQSDGAPIQVVVDGVDANTARLVEGYVEGAWGSWLAAQAASHGQALTMPVDLQQRIWFNSELRSRNYPGARPGGHHHDPDRRAAHGAGHGPRVGARHHGGADGDAGHA